MTDLSSQPVLQKLQELSRAQGLDSLSKELETLQSLVENDLKDVHNTLSSLTQGSRLVEKGTTHLLQMQGKRLRPLCVFLAAQVGTPQKRLAHELAVAVELVHNATLLHDDVVDMATERRGLPSVRALYGNAISIFAGDLLLTEALKRVRNTPFPDLLDQLLEVLKEMIFAESLQLENRGTFGCDRDCYFQIIQGKTASLFRWALCAGGYAGNLTSVECHALSQYGYHLGIAFQIIDDVLDFSADKALLGKTLFSDLKEGKMTLPLLLACEQDRNFTAWLKEQLQKENLFTEEAKMKIMLELEKNHSLVQAREMAAQQMKKALSFLEKFPLNQAVEALVTVATVMLQRQY